MILGSREIKSNGRPYIIAEIGVNHEGSIDKAKELIDLASEGGADAAKFQTYKAATLASKNSPSYWDLSKETTRSQFELFQKYDSFNEKDYIELASHCRKRKIDFLSTPFDDDAVDFLYPLVPFYKIASADITNIPFLRKIAEKDKPVVLSTGASSLCEIEAAVTTLRSRGCNDIGLLHCILNYPTSDENAHLNMIRGLSRVFSSSIIGYSDHTLPDKRMINLTTAYNYGALILEKHFTYDKSLPGNDHYHSMDVSDLKCFVENIEQIQKVMGSSSKEPLETERISRENARRSIVLSAPVSAGEIFSESNMTYKRPGSGISPMYWDDVLGKKAARNLEEDHILLWTDIDDKIK